MYRDNAHHLCPLNGFGYLPLASHRQLRQRPLVNHPHLGHEVGEECGVHALIHGINVKLVEHVVVPRFAGRETKVPWFEPFGSFPFAHVALKVVGMDRLRMGAFSGSEFTKSWHFILPGSGRTHAIFFSSPGKILRELAKNALGWANRRVVGDVTNLQPGMRDSCFPACYLLRPAHLAFVSIRVHMPCSRRGK